MALTLQEMSRLGGLARARKLSKRKRQEIGRLGGKASARAARQKARKRASKPARGRS